MQGRVKFFNEKKGFGFISGDDGQDVFVHVSMVKEQTLLKEGDPVSYNTKETDRGPQAVDVELVDQV